jgi:hypothetical protein
VQFPWRWMEPLALASAFFTAAALDFSGRHRAFRASSLALVAVLALVAAIGVLIAKDAWWDDEDVPFLASSIASSHGFEGTDEYTPAGCDHYELPGALPDSDSALDPEAGLHAVAPNPRVALFNPQSGKTSPAARVRLHTLRWTSESKLFEADTPRAVTLAVRLLNYPAWDVRVDGAHVQTDSAPVTAQMLLALPSGSHRVEIKFHRTWDRITGDAISLVSVIALLGVGWFSRERRTQGEKPGG